jgi:hypothetical protein
MTTHAISLDEFRPGRWRSVCSCGQYKSSGYQYRGAAESAGAQHVRAKGAIPA